MNFENFKSKSWADIDEEERFRILLKWKSLVIKLVTPPSP
jgi:hypothetical protein